MAVTRYTKPNFIAGTAGTGAFGIVGALAAISEGNRIIKENDVKDPAMLISHDISNLLSNKYNLEIMNSDLIADSNEISNS